MKLYLLLISLALASAAINYNDLSSYTDTTCTTRTPWTTGLQEYTFQSPIALQNTQCLPYGYFQLSATNPPSGTLTADPDTGAILVGASGYTGLTFQSDEWKWESEEIMLRRKAEHLTYLLNPADPTAETARADLEIQIKMRSTVGGNPAFMSFLVQGVSLTSTAAADKAKLQSLEAIKIATITSTPAVDVNLDLATVTSTIMAKLNAGLYLNMFTYNGTTTYPDSTTSKCDKATWFIYGSVLYVDTLIISGIQTWLNNNVGSYTGFTFVTSGSDSYNYRKAVDASHSAQAGGGAANANRMCFTGYFDIYLNWNYGLWFGVVIIVFFFIITLSTGECPITDPDYQEECKTIHPWVSLWVVGNELHTRKSRASLILAIITIHALFDSVWYRISKNPEQPANIIVYAAYSMCISQFLVWFYGNILRKYYIHKREFLQTKDEKHNQHAQNKLFAYYSTLFALIAICWPFCVWNMNELNPHHSQKSSNYWVASFFVGMGLEWFVIDLLWVALAKKSKFIRNFIAKKGFFYDNLMHATYMDYIKMD